MGTHTFPVFPIVPSMGQLYAAAPERVRSLWTPVYNNRELQLGATATINNFGDVPNYGELDAATGTGMKFNASGLSPTWTHSSPLSAWDTPFDLTLPSNWQGIAPALTLNGTDEEMDTPGVSFFSTTGAFSVGMWIYLSTLTNNVILAKWDATTGAELREFFFSVDGNGDINFTIYDEANNAGVGRKQEAPLVAGQWYSVVGTFSGGTDAADVSIAVNGVLTDDATTIDDGGFADVVDTATVVSLGYQENTSGVKDQRFDGKMLGGPWGPFYVQAELTAEQIAALWARERLGVGV